MKKLFFMIALGTISFGTVMAAVPVTHKSTAKTDTVVRKKVKKRKNGTMRVKIKKDSV
ncbi:MAG: hypothetical protein ACTHNW_05780 [Mucilaginibacter sp.]